MNLHSINFKNKELFWHYQLLNQLYYIFGTRIEICINRLPILIFFWLILGNSKYYYVKKKIIAIFAV